MTTHPEGLTGPADDSRALSAQETNVGAPQGAIRARQGEDDAAAVMTTGGGVELWKIRVAGYGTFDFTGTEDEAEEMRRHKANWERGVGIKWRVNNQTDQDRKMAARAAAWDRGDGA